MSRAVEVEAALDWLRAETSNKVHEEMGPRYGLVVDEAFGVKTGKG